MASSRHEHGVSLDGTQSSAETACSDARCQGSTLLLRATCGNNPQPGPGGGTRNRFSYLSSKATEDQCSGMSGAR